MRIEHLEQRLGDLRELVVDLEVDARREKRERLDQPLDVRILALAALEQQPAGDLRVLLGELRRHPADERQLAFVVGEQLVPHHYDVLHFVLERLSAA